MPGVVCDDVGIGVGIHRLSSFKVLPSRGSVLSASVMPCALAPYSRLWRPSRRQKQKAPDEMVVMMEEERRSAEDGLEVGARRVQPELARRGMVHRCLARRP